MHDIGQYQIEIVTGLYPSTDKVQQQMLYRLLGERAEYDFEIYFHWYNLIHELGHAIIFFHSGARSHPAEEEQLVNDFAFAYWQHYGEPDKISALSNIVSQSLKRFIPPAEDGVNYLKYAKSLWGKEELYTFNNYGWFQFSCVQHSISNPISLEQALMQMGISKTQLQPQSGFIMKYPIDRSTPRSVLDDAIRVLRAWGIPLPQKVKLTLSDDPNCQMCKTDKL